MGQGNICVFILTAGDGSKSCDKLWPGWKRVRGNPRDEPQKTHLGRHSDSCSSRQIQLLVSNQLARSIC